MRGFWFQGLECWSFGFRCLGFKVKGQICHTGRGFHPFAFAQELRLVMFFPPTREPKKKLKKIKIKNWKIEKITKKGKKDKNMKNI